MNLREKWIVDMSSIRSGVLTATIVAVMPLAVSGPAEGLAVKADPPVAKEMAARVAAKCRKLKLTGKSPQTGFPVTASIRNSGPGRVVIETKTIPNLMIVEASLGKTNMFFGDPNYRYYVRLVDRKSTATIEICPL